MDTPRRWQVASLATAVASLGIGGALMTRPSVEQVPTIDLDQVEARADVPVQPIVELDADPVGPLIVLPRGISVPASVTPVSDTVVSASTGSTVSVDEPGDAPSPAPTTPAPAAPAPTEPAPQPSTPREDSPDDPSSVDSVDSVDSSD